MDLSNLWAPFLTWQFGVAALAIVAIIATFKRIVRIGYPLLLTTTWMKIILAGANMVLGALVAIPKDFLIGPTYVQRLLVGLCAGFLSSYLYAILLKRLGPVDDVQALLRSEAITKREKAPLPPPHSNR